MPKVSVHTVPVSQPILRLLPAVTRPCHGPGSCPGGPACWHTVSGATGTDSRWGQPNVLLEGGTPPSAHHRNTQTMQVAPQRKLWVLLLETQGETPLSQKCSAGARRAVLNLWGYQKTLLGHNITTLNKCNQSLSTLWSSVTLR